MYPLKLNTTFWTEVKKKIVEYKIAAVVTHWFVKCYELDLQKIFAVLQ